MKQKINNILNDPRNQYFQGVNDILAITTIVSVLAIVLETLPQLKSHHTIFVAIEYAAVVIFGLEYLARIYSAPKRRAYIFSFFGLVDLLAIIPSFLHLANLTFLKSARVLRILRMLRMIRLAKLASLRNQHYSDAEHHISIYHLNIQIYLAALAATLLLFGCATYIVEAGHEGFQSIPHGILWAADQVVGGGVTPHFPQTVPGQIVTLLARFAGLVLLGVLLTVVNHMFKNLLFGDKKAIRQRAPVRKR
jgi:voltage-gated potassium channel